MAGAGRGVGRYLLSCLPAAPSPTTTTTQGPASCRCLLLSCPAHGLQLLPASLIKADHCSARPSTPDGPLIFQEDELPSAPSPATAGPCLREGVLGAQAEMRWNPCRGLPEVTSGA